MGSPVAAMGTHVRGHDGALVAAVWMDSRGQFWATGYRGRGLVTVPTAGPFPTREAALAAVGVTEEEPGRGALATGART